MVLFAKMDYANCVAIRKVLNVFCGVLGQTISEAKGEFGSAF